MPGRFLHRTNERRLPADFAAVVLIWDIDKTYLATRFSTFRGLARIPFEVAIDKADVPGSVPVLRALRRGPGPNRAFRPLYFVSGSPPQIRSALERKMTLDGVEFDGITFKDQLGLVRTGRFKSLTGQLGYKLRALLLLRWDLPAKARFLCFGDDTESDAEAFSLFGQVMAGLRGRDLVRRLEQAEVPRWEIDEALALSNPLPVGDDPVERTYIHEWRGGAPGRFARFPRIVPTRSYLQTALHLAGEGWVTPETVSVVAKALRRRLIDEARIRADARDAVERLGVPTELALRVQ